MSHGDSTVLQEKDVDAFIARCIDGIRAAVDMGAKPATLTEAAGWIREPECGS